MVKKTDERIHNIEKDDDLTSAQHMSNDQGVTNPELTNVREESKQVLRTKDWEKAQRYLQSMVKLPVYDKNDKTHTPFIKVALYFGDGSIVKVNDKNITANHPSITTDMNGVLVLQSPKDTYTPVFTYTQVQHLHFTKLKTEAMYDSNREPVLLDGKMITNKNPQIIKRDTLLRYNVFLIMYPGQENQYIVPGLMNYNNKRRKSTQSKNNTNVQIFSHPTLETSIPDTIQNNNSVIQGIASSASATEMVIEKTPDARQPLYLITNEGDRVLSTNMQLINAKVVTEFGSLNPPHSSFSNSSTATHKTTQTTKDSVRLTESVTPNIGDTSKPTIMEDTSKASTESLSTSTFVLPITKTQKSISATLPIYDENKEKYTLLVEKSLYFEDGSTVKMNGKNISMFHPQIHTENEKIFFVNGRTSTPVFDYSSVSRLHYTSAVREAMYYDTGEPIKLNDQYITKKHPQIKSTGGRGVNSKYYFVSNPNTSNQESISGILSYRAKMKRYPVGKIKLTANQKEKNISDQQAPLQPTQQTEAVLTLEPTVSTPVNEPVKRKQSDKHNNETQQNKRHKLSTGDKGNTPESSSGEKDNRPAYHSLFNSKSNDQNQLKEDKMVEDQPLLTPQPFLNLNDQALNEVGAKPGLKVSPTARLLAFFGLVSDHNVDQEGRDQKLIEIERIKQNQIEAFKTHGRKKVIKIESIELEFVLKEFNDFCDLYQNAVAILKNNNQLISISEDNNESFVNDSIVNDILLALTILNQCYEIGTAILKKLNDHPKYNVDIERKDLDNAIDICNNNMFIVAHTISQAIEGVCKIKDNAECKSFTKVKSLKQSKKAGKNQQAETNVMVETDSLSKTNIAMRLYQEEIDQRKECLNRKTTAFFTQMIDSMCVVFNPVTKDPSGPIDLNHRICAKIMFSVLDQKQVESYINHICQLVFGQDIEPTNEPQFDPNMTKYDPNNNNSDPKSVGRRAKS